MKTILAVATAVLFGSATLGTAHAQSEDYKHMFEFNADSVLQGLLSFDKSKIRGNDADNDTQLELHLNYAYALPMHPALQLGSRIDYLKDTVAGRGDAEDYSLQVGAIYNFAGLTQQRTTDLTNSMYVSLYLGLGWANTYGAGAATSGRKDEVLKSTVAIGKRFDLRNWGISHLVYTPEIALQNENSTTGSNFEYTQNIQLRFLQFSVFY